MHPFQVHSACRGQFTASIPEHREYCSCIWFCQHDARVHLPCGLQASNSPVSLMITWLSVQTSIVSAEKWM